MKSIFDKLKRSVLILFLVLMNMGMFISCSDDVLDKNLGIKEENNEYCEVRPTKLGEIHVLKNEATNYICEPVISDSLVVFSDGVPNGIIPNIGEAIFIPESENTPYGFLGKIVSIEKGETTKVFTKQVALDEVFESLNLDTTFTTIDVGELYDIDGSPIPFEVVDTITMDSTTLYTVGKSLNPVLARGKSGSLELTKQAIRFPIKIYNENLDLKGNSHVDLNGFVSIGLKEFDFDVNIDENGLQRVKLHMSPFIHIDLLNEWVLESGFSIRKRLGIWKTKIKIPTAIGLPIIIPITIFIDVKPGVEGEALLTLGLSYKNSFTCGFEFSNGQVIDKYMYHQGKHGNNAKGDGEITDDSGTVAQDEKSKGNLWEVYNFSLEGKAYLSSEMGVLLGLYSASTGIGANFSPKYELKGEAKIEYTFDEEGVRKNSELLEKNPKVNSSLKIGSELYFIAGLFGNSLGKLSIKFPELSIIDDDIYLLPQIKDIEAYTIYETKINDFGGDEGVYSTILKYKINELCFLRDAFLTSYLYVKDKNDNNVYIWDSRYEEPVNKIKEKNLVSYEYKVPHEYLNTPLYFVPITWIGNGNLQIIGKECSVQMLDTCVVKPLTYDADFNKEKKGYLNFRIDCEGQLYGGNVEGGLYILDHEGYHYYPNTEENYSSNGKFSIDEILEYSCSELDELDDPSSRPYSSFNNYNAKKKIKYGGYIKREGGYKYEEPRECELIYSTNMWALSPYRDGINYNTDKIEIRGSFFIDEVRIYERIIKYTKVKYDYNSYKRVINSTETNIYDSFVPTYDGMYENRKNRRINNNNTQYDYSVRIVVNGKEIQLGNFPEFDEYI